MGDYSGSDRGGPAAMKVRSPTSVAYKRKAEEALAKACITILVGILLSATLMGLGQAGIMVTLAAGGYNLAAVAQLGLSVMYSVRSDNS